MLHQLSYEVTSVRMGDVSELSLVPSISVCEDNTISSISNTRAVDTRTVDRSVDVEYDFHSMILFSCAFLAYSDL